MPSSSKAPLFYGWKLCWLAMFGNFMIQGGAVYLMNAFIEPFSDLYGWSRGDMSTALGLGSFCGMAAVPLLASLSLRVSLRAIMLAGALVGGVCLALLGQFSELWLFTVTLCALWIASQACGGVIANALMSNWFIKHKGRAFGIVAFGMSFSGAILPFIALALIKFFSVKTAAAALGATALVILVPGVLFFVRDAPADMGMHPDGEAPAQNADETPREKTPAEPAPGVGELLRSPLVYRVGIAFSLSIMGGAGLVGQLKPRFSDLGFGDYTAMGFMCATAFFIACGKVAWGWVCDRQPPIRVAKILFAYNIGAFLLALLPPNVFTVSLFALVCGIGVGGSWTVLPAVVVDIFGRAHFMAVYRVISLFIFFKSFGYIVMGQFYEYTGSYDAAFVFFSATSAVSLLLTPKNGTKYRAARLANP